MALRDGRKVFKILFIIAVFKILFQKPFQEISINVVI